MPKDAFDPNFVSPGEDIKSDGGQVVAKSWTITVKDRSTSEAFELLAGPLKGYVKVQFHAVGKLNDRKYHQASSLTWLLEDTWMEEDTPIQVHPKDPFKRIDIVHSRRHIRVFVGGKVVADTTSSMHLFETGLPTRYYMPLSAVDQTVLRPTKTRSQCPYKGESEYYSVVIDGKEYKDVVWYYTNPKVESAGIAGLVCFYNEKVEIEIDGKKEPKRQSPWS